MMNKNEFSNKIREALEGGDVSILRDIWEDGNINIEVMDKPFDISNKIYLGYATIVQLHNGENYKREKIQTTDKNGHENRYWLETAQSATFCVETDEDDGHVEEVNIYFTEDAKEDLISDMVEKYWDEQDF